MADKETRRLIRTIGSWDGWRVIPTKAGWIAYPPDRTVPGIAIHATPSDHRATANVKARLRRAGAPI
jgi:hypothetical protein